MREAPENFFLRFFSWCEAFFSGGESCEQASVELCQGFICRICNSNSTFRKQILIAIVLASLGLHQVQVLQNRSWSWGWRFYAWGCSRRKRRDCMIWAQLAHIHWKSLWFLLGLGCFNFNLLKAEFGRKNNKNAISNLKVTNLLVFLVAGGMFGAQNCILQFQLHCWKNSSTLGDLEPPPY